MGPPRPETSTSSFLALPLEFAKEIRPVLSEAITGLGDLIRAEPILGRITPWNEEGKTLQNEIENHVRYCNINLE